MRGKSEGVLRHGDRSVGPVGGTAASWTRRALVVVALLAPGVALVAVQAAAGAPVPDAESAALPLPEVPAQLVTHRVE